MYIYCHTPFDPQAGIVISAICSCAIINRPIAHDVTAPGDDTSGREISNLCIIKLLYTKQIL
jgi:hypothetical protein